MNCFTTALARAAAALVFVASAAAQTHAPASAGHAAVEFENRPSKVATEHSLTELSQLADAAVQAMANEEYEQASRLFGQILSARNFASVDGNGRHHVLTNAAKIASMQSDFDQAHSLYAQSSQLDQAGSGDWMGRLNAAWFLGDFDDAVASLSRIAEYWPEELAFVSEWAMDSLLAHLRKRDANAEFMLLQALFDTNWQTDLGREPAGLWLRLFELLAQRDLHESALAVASKIRDPIAMVSVLSDRRFLDIVTRAPEWFSVEEAMDAGIIEARLAVEANSHLLAPAVELAQALLHAGRQSEALLVIDIHMARSAFKSVIGDTFEDGISETVRALTVRALVLISLNRYEEAAAALDLAAQQSLPGDRLADFLTVAELQAWLGLSDAALTTLERSRSGAHGARAYFVRFIAARMHNDSPAEKRALALLMERASESPAEAQRALLMAGKIDAAADLLINRLNDPAQRPNAILELQRMDEQTWPAAKLDWRSQVRVLLSREDVLETVAATGGIVSDYAIYRWN